MSNCSTCVCTGPAGLRPPRGADCGEYAAGRLLLSVPKQQPTAVVEDVASRLGLVLDLLAPGLWELRGDRVHRVVGALRAVTSMTEAAQIRVLIAAATATDRELLTAALAAPSLEQLDARDRGGQLGQLFAEEQSAFRSAYQPIIALPDRRVVAFEALLRARTAEGAELAPEPLFAQAQRAGWSPRLDRIGRTSALHGAAGWLGDRSLFVNFIPTSIYDPRVCLATTERAAVRAGIPLAQVVFEVTESEQVADLGHLQAIFDHYRERGCRVALDDLGAGYSSLAMLVQLEPDVVKLDRTLIEHLPDPTSTAVVRAVVEITHAYGGLVLAEGVETEIQSSSAQELGVDLGQGWLYGRPAFPASPNMAGLRDTAHRKDQASRPRSDLRVGPT